MLNQKKRFLITLLFTAILLLSWFFHPTRMAWDFIDHHSFKFFNGFISNRERYQNFWTICNHRIIDWLHDFVMITFFIVFIIRSLKGHRVRSCIQSLLCITYFILTILYVNKGFFNDVIHVYRDSPSITYEDATCLSKKVKWISVKDNSRRSYPGDHGTTACLFAFSIFYLMGWRAGLLASSYGVFMCLPRLIAGAHWATDIIMGSVPIALFSSSIVLLTPLEPLITKNITLLLRKAGAFLLIRKQKALNE